MIMELFNIAGKKAIVTGGTRGLGCGMAEGLMEAGCEVVIVGTSDKVYDVAKGFCDRGFKCHGVKADFSKREQVYQGFNDCVAALGRDFAFKKKSPILPIIYETKRGIKIRNKNYSFFMYKQSKRTPFRV